LRREHRRVVERLQQLRQRVGRAQTIGKLAQHAAMRRRHVGRPVECGTPFAQQVRHPAKVRGSQQVDHERVDALDDFRAYRAVDLQLEDVEQHRCHVRAKILTVFPGDLGVEIFDLEIVASKSDMLTTDEARDSSTASCAPRCTSSGDAAPPPSPPSARSSPPPPSCSRSTYLYWSSEKSASHSIVTRSSSSGDAFRARWMMPRNATISSCSNPLSIFSSRTPSL